MSLDVISIPQRIYDALQYAANPSKAALVVEQESFSYHDLRNLIFGLANYLKDVTAENAEKSHVAVLARQDLYVYQGILSCIVSGITYVPLSTIHPIEKSAYMIKHSDSNYLIVSPQQVDYAITMLREHFTADELSHLKIICDHATAEQLLQVQANFNAAQHAQLQANLLEIESFTNIAGHNLIDQDYLEPFDFVPVPFEDPTCTESQGQRILHILYTSGTTGQPKGVPTSQRNYATYFAQILKLYQFQDNDVFSHFTELTFNISLQDPLSALCCGGTLICPNNFDRLAPLEYIASHNITVVHTVPFLLYYLARMHLNSSTPIESVRLSIFIGEALYYKSLLVVARLFPRSRIINTYGATEATVAVSYYEVNPATLIQTADATTAQSNKTATIDITNGVQEQTIGSQATEATRAIVPLGQPFSVTMDVIDSDGKSLKENEVGELVLSGPQISCGYYHNAAKTETAFFTKDGHRYYHTGDMAYWENDPRTNTPLFHYVGRNDDMIKLQSYRLSFYEIEEKLGEFTSHQVRTLAYTNSATHEKLLIAVVEEASPEEITEMHQQVRKHVVFYMQPRYILSCEKFPLNANGKFDRKALHKQMQQQVSTLLGLAQS